MPLIQEEINQHRGQPTIFSLSVTFLLNLKHMGGGDFIAIFHDHRSSLIKILIKFIGGHYLGSLQINKVIFTSSQRSGMFGCMLRCCQVGKFGKTRLIFNFFITSNFVHKKSGGSCAGAVDLSCISKNKAEVV